MQNLSEVTQPLTAKATERELSLSTDNKNSDSSDDTHKNLGKIMNAIVHSFRWLQVQFNASAYTPSYYDFSYIWNAMHHSQS